MTVTLYHGSTKIIVPKDKAAGLIAAGWKDTPVTARKAKKEEVKDGDDSRI